MMILIGHHYPIGHPESLLPESLTTQHNITNKTKSGGVVVVSDPPSRFFPSLPIIPFFCFWSRVRFISDFSFAGNSGAWMKMKWIKLLWCDGWTIFRSSIDKSKLRSKVVSKSGFNVTVIDWIKYRSIRMYLVESSVKSCHGCGVHLCRMPMIYLS